jgi:PAS domain S-box-containing protein
MAWSIRPDGTVDFLNQRLLKYMGVSFEEALEQPTGAVHPEDLPSVMEKWQARMAAGEPFEAEMRLRRADGEYRWFLTRTEPLRNEHGILVDWYGVAIDIEDRRQAEEKLKQSESQLAEGQRLAHVGSWDWDLRSNHVTWSDEIYRIFGLQPGTIKVAGDAMPFIHPEDRNLVSDTVQSSITTKEPYSFYYRVLRPDGDERMVHSRGVIVSDEDGDPIKVAGATQDVTELKRTEEKLKATSEQLRALSERLRKAKEEEGIRIARELHDELGSTLTSLKWGLLGIDKTKSKTGKAASNAREKIAEMVGLVDSTINTVRRISSELRPGVVDDLGLVSAIEWHAQQFQDNTGIVCRFESNVEDVDLNREQATTIFRIFQEAMTNILRHAQATKVNILIEEEEGEFVLEIKDNGRGITEGEKLGTRSLGLLGMRERAYAVGGTVEISGTAGKGTVLIVRLPNQTISDFKARTGSIEVNRPATSSLSRKEKS